jgi:N-acetylmuramoyl-L-alanine amidase
VKKWIVILSLILIVMIGLNIYMYIQTKPPVDPVPVQTLPPATAAPETRPTVPETVPTEAPTETTAPYILTFTEEEEQLLLKIGMAERGSSGCTDCIALVMRTVLNRVESPKFSSTIRGVIYAQDQFTPVAEGTFESVIPNDRCREALDMVKQGWDESRGALYYEWCEGESWHSQNLNLLFQHCDVRFYN